MFRDVARRMWAEPLGQLAWDREESGLSATRPRFGKRLGTHPEKGRGRPVELLECELRSRQRYRGGAVASLALAFVAVTVGGCGVQSLRYDGLSMTRRPRSAKVDDRPHSELLSDGYVLIGEVRARRRGKGSLVPVLAAKAASHGGDLVVVEHDYDSQDTVRTGTYIQGVGGPIYVPNTGKLVQVAARDASAFVYTYDPTLAENERTRHRLLSAILAGDYGAVSALLNSGVTPGRICAHLSKREKCHDSIWEAAAESSDDRIFLALTEAARGPGWKESSFGNPDETRDVIESLIRKDRAELLETLLTSGFGAERLPDQAVL